MVEEAKLRNDHVLVVGDLNKLVGSDHQGIPGNHPEVSVGGHLIRDLIESGEWLMVNSMEGKTVGGPFTRMDPATGHLSCLDLWLCTIGLAPHIKCLEIDSGRKMPIARPMRRNGRWHLTHSDHFSMILTLENLPTRQQSVSRKKETAWNLARKDGWERYKNLT